jgi:dihydropteroate synthase
MSFIQRPVFEWKLRTRSLSLGRRTVVMGVLNVTPDSFSDGGRFLSPSKALAQALHMLDEGAEILDIGGESTHPRSQRDLSALEEQQRVLAVIAAILRERPRAILSIDTYKAETARMAVSEGVEIVNDVSGLQWDPEMAAACAELECGVVLMHTRGRPEEWRQQPRLAPDAVLPLVRDELRAHAQVALQAGVARERIALDPGFGFGKLLAENYPLLAQLGELHALGFPLLVGTSRKSFLGKALAMLNHGVEPAPEDRLYATIASTTAAILAGVQMVRVHDVRPALEAAAIADEVLAHAQRAGDVSLP